MQPGDVLLLSGRGDLEQRLQGALRSPWNQTAVVIPWRSDSSSIALLQCTSRHVAPDIESGKTFSGVQVVSIAEQLRLYRGVIAVRPLTPLIGEQEQESLTAFAATMRGRPFNASPYYSARALRRRNPAGNSEFFCTEFAAATYMHIGVLQAPSKGRAASNYAPSDFAQETECLCLTGSHSFGTTEPCTNE